MDELQEYKQEHMEMESLLKDNRIKYVSRFANREHLEIMKDDHEKIMRHMS